MSICNKKNHQGTVWCITWTPF